MHGHTAHVGMRLPAPPLPRLRAHLGNGGDVGPLLCAVQLPQLAPQLPLDQRVERPAARCRRERGGSKVPWSKVRGGLAGAAAHMPTHLLHCASAARSRAAVSMLLSPSCCSRCSLIRAMTSSGSDGSEGGAELPPSAPPAPPRLARFLAGLGGMLARRGPPAGCGAHRSRMTSEELAGVAGAGQQGAGGGLGGLGCPTARLRAMCEPGASGAALRHAVRLRAQQTGAAELLLLPCAWPDTGECEAMSAAAWEAAPGAPTSRAAGAPSLRLRCRPAAFMRAHAYI